jgi:hypothetical protein
MKKTIISISDLRAWVFIFGILIILSGCKSSKKEPAETTQPLEEKTAKEKVIVELSGYPIPTSFEIMKMINESGASYIYTLSNLADKVDQYITSKEKALNLGVYGADLSYAITYGMKQEAMLYLEASIILITEMGISTAFNVNYVQRIEDNQDDKDSLISVLSDSFIDTWDYLTENEKAIQAVLIASGSWIEGLYISTQIAINAPDNTHFLEIIASQKNSLHKLLEIIAPVKDDIDVFYIYNGLMDLSKIYEEIEEELTTEQFEQVLDAIELLRESIV